MGGGGSPVPQQTVTTQKYYKSLLELRTAMGPLFILRVAEKWLWNIGGMMGES